MKGKVVTAAKLHYVNGVVYFVVESGNITLQSIADNSKRTTPSGKAKHPLDRVRTLTRLAEGVGLVTIHKDKTVEATRLGEEFYNSRGNDKWRFSKAQKELLCRHILSDPYRTEIIYSITSLLSLVKQGYKDKGLIRKFAITIGKLEAWKSEVTGHDFTGFFLNYIDELGLLKVNEATNKMRNPKWSRDELILVLHMYLQNPKSPPSKDSKEVFEMSETLKKLNVVLGGDANSKFRNPNGVYMKMMNFRRFDDSVGGTGLTRGGKDEKTVWDLYSKKPKELSRIAQNIKEIINSDIKLPETLEEIDEEDSEEGKISTRTHKNRERNQKIVKKKKDRFLKENGKLFCEACEFDFIMTYGSRGDGFIECHHIKHLSEIDGTTKTKLSDLVLLCANCHRMIHRKKPWLSVGQLKALL